MAAMTIELHGWIYEIGDCGPKKPGETGRDARQEEGFNLKMDRGRRIFFPVSMLTLRRLVNEGAFNKRVKITMSVDVIGDVGASVTVEG